MFSLICDLNFTFFEKWLTRQPCRLYGIWKPGCRLRKARIKRFGTENQAFGDRAVAVEGHVLEQETYLTHVNAHVGQSAGHQQHLPPAPLLKGPQVRKPGTYDGSTKGILLESWMYAMQTYMSFFTIEDDRQKIALAVSYLSGITVEWWHMLEESGSAKPET